MSPFIKYNKKKSFNKSLVIFNYRSFHLRGRGVFTRTKRRYAKSKERGWSCSFDFMFRLSHLQSFFAKLSNYQFSKQNDSHCLGLNLNQTIYRARFFFQFNLLKAGFSGYFGIHCFHIIWLRRKRSLNHSVAFTVISLLF